MLGKRPRNTVPFATGAHYVNEGQLGTVAGQQRNVSMNDRVPAGNVFPVGHTKHHYTAGRRRYSNSAAQTARYR